MGIWSNLAKFLTVGYLSMTRSFAYIGFPPASLFIGELVLAAFVGLKPRVALGTWTSSLLRSSPLSTFCLILLVFVFYGVAQMARGVFNGASIFYTLKFFIFNYYTLYIFFGLWVALHNEDLLPKVIRLVAWVNGLYGLLFALVLGSFESSLFVPGSSVSLFGQPGGSAFAILGLLCVERNLRGVWHLLALNILVTLIMQMRAEWLGLALGMLAWGVLTGRLGKVIGLGLAGLALLGMIGLANIQLPGRTSSVSFGEIVGRIIAPIDIETAKELSPNAEDAAGTTRWRQLWWGAIWDDVHRSPRTTAFGHGYGFDLLSLLPNVDQEEKSSRDTRTPHSIFYFALGYTGWVGVVLFVLLQIAILKLLWRTYKRTRQAVGISLWFMGIAMACFDPSFDTPYRAIPFYLLVGMAIAPGLQARGGMGARPTRSQFLSTARR